MSECQARVIDVRLSNPYIRGMGSPLVLGEPSPCERRLHQRRVDAVQLDITLVCRCSWKTATFSCGSRRSNRFPVWGAVGRYYFRSLSQGFQGDGVSACSPLFSWTTSPYSHLRNMFDETYWQMPPWVSSRSYALGTSSARSILTNACWWTNIVLADASADLWAVLPQRFSLEELTERTKGIGIDLGDTDARGEVHKFLKTLCDDGFLCLTNGANPQPDHGADRSQSAINNTWNMTSVEVDFNDWLTGQNILPSAFIELTYRCNQRCVHCFNPGAAHCPNEHPSRGTDELTTKELSILLEELASMGVYTVTFSGGEASQRSDLLEILERAKHLGFSFNLFTNGQMSAKLVEDICLLWPRTVGVSLYSVVPDIHDATTGVPGSFHQTLHALRMLCDAGIRATIKSPLMRHTVFGYKRLLALADELNALPQFDLHISASVDGDTACTVHQLLDEEVLSLVMRDPRAAMYVGLDVPNVGRRQRPVNQRVCGAGKFSLSISPDGTIYPCNSLPLPVGNIRNGGLRRVWDESAALRSWNSVVLSDFDECGMYAYCAYCNHCPGMAMMECGNMFASHKTCCTTARVRMKISEDLRKGIDPLQNRPSSENGAFGHSQEVHLPTVNNGVANPRPANDPRKLSTAEFIRNVERIHSQGNGCRKSIQPEPDSPAVENTSVGDLEQSSRFHEFGR